MSKPKTRARLATTAPVPLGPIYGVFLGKEAGACFVVEPVAQRADLAQQDVALGGFENSLPRHGQLHLDVAIVEPAQIMIRKRQRELKFLTVTDRPCREVPLL